MAPPLLSLQNISLMFGTTPLLAGAELAVSAGDRICLVGRNGSGKSTLLKIAAGLVQPDAGRRFTQPGATIQYLPQEPDFSGFPTTLAYVEAGLGDTAANRYRATYLLEQLGLTGAEDPALLSGGEARRAALARVLAPEPDILLLDEPTNHLDLPGIEWLESELARLKSGLVLISHDRRLLERLSRATLWLDRGVTRQLDQGFAHFEAWRDQVLGQEETERHKLGRKIVAEEDWLRYGVTARRKRNQKRLADLHALRKRHKEQRAAVGKVRLEAAEADLSGRLVIVAEHATKAFGERVVVRDFSARVIRGDRIGIVGRNGAGKTTLLNLLTGELPPDSGEVTLGTNLARVTLDQGRATLDPDETLIRTLTGGKGDTVTVGGQNRHVIGYMKDFLFGPEQANTPVGVLSGGERGRLTLALAFATPSNLLVLDEPTNDLDLETLELLQERLSDYAGTVLLVSHDRDFLDRVVTSVIATDGDGVWTEYAGGYSDMLAQRGGASSEPRKDRPRPAGLAATPSPASAPVRTPNPTPARKLSFKDKHALETLPKRMADLEAEIGRLNAELADADLYARKPDRFIAATKALETAQAALGAAEEQWLELEMLREALEQA
ncbi:ABC-F family ATP-binding cassette domain-containing protein [Rhodopila sp.]|uniref:ABC-F family ATP-binding cassette domain-containing protein n=1 Tax=Rhodopila sp. TaxID=2480087 RepID=UPI002C495519|nr:ATP-binding cassette domain-containing protein [Rhodopila sp.]HVZ09988.1 ATP-binding cassette domain-containing protein [Rhodopila sp.]